MMIGGEEWVKRRKTKGGKCFFFLNLQKMHKGALKKKPETLLSAMSALSLHQISSMEKKV